MLPSEKKMVLLNILADGEYHSGEELGGIVGVSRAAIWKTLQGFSEWGIAVVRTRGKGYQIEGGLDLLNRDVICELCSHSVLSEFEALDVHLSLDSTNTQLLEAIRKNPSAKTRQICMAEMQLAGRGRRGRSWQSPFARNIYLSVSWPFEGGAAAMQGLSLAVGLAVVSALEELGCQNLSLKWPNDILVNGAKLGGILVEIVGDVSGLCHGVIGVGLNVAMPSSYAREIDQDWVDIASIVDVLPRRDVITAKVLEHLLVVLHDFQAHGFAQYRDAWDKKNAHADKEVTLSSASNTTLGIMRGVSSSGAVRIEIDGEIQEHVGGELSLRLVS